MDIEEMMTEAAIRKWQDGDPLSRYQLLLDMAFVDTQKAASFWITMAAELRAGMQLGLLVVPRQRELPTPVMIRLTELLVILTGLASPLAATALQLQAKGASSTPTDLVKLCSLAITMCEGVSEINKEARHILGLEEADYE